MAVRVVTDSTAYLSTDADTARLVVVPLIVTMSGHDRREGLEVSPADVARALEERRFPVTTSRPAPADFEATYRRLLDDGADAVVSIHLSAKLSGTCDAARLAAKASGRVEVLDSATAGMALGLIVLAAQAAADAGGDVAAVREAAASASRRSSTVFYVDTLEYLRRGGRISAASAIFGTALSVKPILHIAGGEVVLREKVRTSARGLARLAELAELEAGSGEVEIALQHLAAPQRAEEVRDALVTRLGERVRAVYVAELGAVIGAHTGPGVVGVAVQRLP